MPAAADTAASSAAPLASVPVLLWPPSHAADPSQPRVDLLSFMLDPKKPVDAAYQMVEITADRIFFLRYPNLERDTQDWVRRELQECFAEQGCARSISVKEWAKQTTERQTPRLRLRCTKVCGFGFQVNFDMERQQYYVVRSRGKSGNFFHKCPAPVVEDNNNNNNNNNLKASPPAQVMSAPSPPALATPPATVVVAPAPTMATTATTTATGFAPVPPQNSVSVGTETIILPKPETSTSVGHHQRQNSGFEMPPPHIGSVPPPPAAEDLSALDDFPLMIPTPLQNTSHEHHHHQQQPTTEISNMYDISAPAPVDSFAAAPTPVAPFGAAAPAPFSAPVQTSHGDPHAAPAATTTVFFHPSELSRDAAAEQGGEIHDMDVSSVDSTDMMIARHFGTGQSAALSALSDNSDIAGGSGTRAASRMQVNNEAEYPTVGSIRSFLSMMTGSINSTVGKAWFGRSTSINASGSNVNTINRDENMLTANSNAAASYLINTTGAPRQKSRSNDNGGGDPMDTVNSALSALSVSGMHTLGTMYEENASTAGDGNPFSADFWSPPSPGSS